MKLNALKKQHLVLGDVYTKLLLIFSLQILVIIIMIFVELTFILYFYILHWNIGTIINQLDNPIYDLYLLVIIMHYSIKIVLIVWACETGHENYTTVHNLLNNILDAQIKKEIIFFKYL